MKGVRPMKARLSSVAIVSTLALGWAAVSFAQTPYGSGESARCNTMSGEEKEQCLRDEANKTQGAPKDTASSGATREPVSPGESYGRSPRCDKMTVADKEKCLMDEARKDETRKDETPATSITGD